MNLPPVIRDAIRLLYLAVLEHQYVLLFFVVAIEEAGVPLPAPTDVVIAYYGYRARGDLPELAQVVLVCALASTAGTLMPYYLARKYGPTLAHRWRDGSTSTGAGRSRDRTDPPVEASPLYAWPFVPGAGGHALIAERRRCPCTSSRLRSHRRVPLLGVWVDGGRRTRPDAALHRRPVHHLRRGRDPGAGHRVLHIPAPSRAEEMGVRNAYAAYLSLGLAALAAVGLWFGIWLVAALALAFLVGGRREPVTLAADAIVFVGLAGHADPLWVALLVVASLATREHDPRAILILLFASVAAILVYVDWTILTGLLAIIATVRAAFAVRRVLRPA